MTADNIQLNGIQYNQENLSELHFTDETEDTWHNAIYHFLENWFDDTDSIITHTTGSTGKPKNIRLRKTVMINSARMTNHFFKLNAESTVLLCMPATYIAGKMMLVRALVSGFNLLTVEPSANPFEMLNQLVDFTAITPYQLFQSAESLKKGLVGKIIVGGSQVTGNLEQLASTIPSELYETYGMTETCSHIALRRFNGKEKSDYFTVLGGVEIHQTKLGCLVIDAPHLLEYEIQTTDLVEIISQNSFRWLGRADSVINSGGVKIHPEQVEKKLEGIIPVPYFITSVPDQLFENKVVLVIESEAFTTEQELDLKLKMQPMLHKFEFPKQIYYLTPFVYSQNNKLLRKETLSKAISPLSGENITR
jgi:O-succinylbenzoic acid--CoA ligase